MPRQSEHPFTEAALARLKPKAKRYDYADADTPGLIVTVRETGDRSFYFRKRLPRSRRVIRERIGRVGEIDVREARKIAKRLAGIVANGGDPGELRRKAAGVQTLGDLWRLYKERHLPRKRDAATDPKRWRTHLEKWERRRLDAISREDVIALLDDIAQESGPIAANRTRALLHCMYELAATEWGIDVSNPVARTRRQREAPRTRYLLPDELRRFVRALREYPDADARDYYTLMLLTGQRGGTVARARWADLHLADATWAIPADAMKAGKPLTVPLAAPVVELLRARHKRADAASPWVFPSSRRSVGFTVGYDDAFASVCSDAEIAGLKPHDLRRSFATYAQRAGARLEVIAAALGHTRPGGVTAVYLVESLDQTRDAVDAAVRHMLALVDGGKAARVLPMRTR